MVDLDQKVEEQLKSDLTGLIKTIRQYGCNAEETKEYVRCTLQSYDNQNGKEDFKKLGACLLYLFDDEARQPKSFYQRIKERLGRK